MKKTLYLLSLVATFGAYAQSGIHTKTPEATLDVRAKNIDGSSAEGIIAPHLSGEALREADIKGTYGIDQNGILVFVTEPPVPQNRLGQTIEIDNRGYYYFDFPTNRWIKTSMQGNNVAKVDAYDCNNVYFSNQNFYTNIPYTGTLEIPYINGNGAAFTHSLFMSNGLTFTLPAGTLVKGNGTLTYHISGTPTNSGMVSVPFNFGTAFCSVNLNIVLSAQISELNCSDSQLQPLNIVKDVTYTGTFSVAYTNGNGGVYPASSFASNGLTFSLPAGTLNNGSGTLQYTVTGTPTASGTIFIPINFAGNSCIANITIPEN